MTTCPTCGRALYRGTKREVEPPECALEDGASCRAYVHGVEVGRTQASTNGGSSA